MTPNKNSVQEYQALAITLALSRELLIYQTRDKPAPPKRTSEDGATLHGDKKAGLGPEQEKYFIELEYLYTDRTGIIEGVPFIATFADGSKKEGSLDEKGYTYISDIPAGQVDVVFGDPEAEKELEDARAELKTYLDDVIKQTKSRAKSLDAALDKLDALDQGLVLTGAFFVGLYDSAMDVADAAKMIAETGIDVMVEIDEAKQKAFNIIASGDIDAAKQELEELVTYGEETLDEIQETYDTLQLLYTDDEIKTMLTDFPEQYFKALPTVEQTGMASGLALNLAFTLVSGGAGGAASIASKAPAFAKATDKIQEIITLLKKVKLHKKQSKAHNNKIAESTDKPKEDKLKEKDKKKFKCDWKKCKGEHTSNINKKYPRKGSVSKGKASSGNDYESEWVSSGLEPWVVNGGYGIDPMLTRQDYETEFSDGVKEPVEKQIIKALSNQKTYVTQKHHIISINLFGSNKVLSHNIKLIDWNINNKENGICLPYFIHDIIRHDLQCHRGPHPPAYNSKLNTMLNTLEQQSLGMCGNNKQKTLKKRLDRIAERAAKHIKQWDKGWYLRTKAVEERIFSKNRLEELNK